MTAQELMEQVDGGGFYLSHDEKSCLLKSADDEPVFVLCARDRGAADVVREWARRYRMDCRHDNHVGGCAVELLEHQQKKYEEALQVANEMDAWRAAHGGGKLPD